MNDARPSFVALIPNGKGVTGVAALGHMNAAGGGRTNPFGEAFGAAGREWTKELCEADSDGDGASNGEELGDPCCTWSPSTGFNAFSPSAVPTHPGVANSFSTEQLNAMTCGGEADLNVVASNGDASSTSGSFDDVVAPTIQPRFSSGPKLDQTSPAPATSVAQSLKTSAVALYCFSIIALALAM
ncbi:uncharacterized protein PITG_14280 [Phytophthora infestans T30-4]|uniref:Temptin Cys/Cys disulfide domain-containing protein n=1 Tax=Phytophthora infestans (strain T30-4) TaxID=403677 RepID=D0NP09_PHYIT|nr:uncharacterized protein PITG_14280 [Phytophthora infestans T30-4]EEY62330.1 conserved hypothetical protein [Phytophthora infestans T30-4]|eukprot:XP_002899361.1 conserved hypothetical protein [Phytophthora infestans T30-4]